MDVLHRWKEYKNNPKFIELTKNNKIDLYTKKYFKKIKIKLGEAK